MRLIPVLLTFLIIGVCVIAEPYSTEVEDADEISEGLGSPESYEEGTPDAAMKFHKPRPHYRHSKEKESGEYKYSKENKSSEEYSKENSKEKNGSKESKNGFGISDDAIILPHEKFCKYFYIFDDMQARLLSCKKGHRFDAEKLQCLKTRDVNCGKRKKNVDSSEEKKARISFKCPRWNGVHKHEYYCHLFYNCKNKKAQLFMCPQGMLFDEYHNKCADRGNVGCNKRIDPTDDSQRPTIKPEVFVCPSKNGKYPHEKDCSAFYKCDRGRYQIQHCSGRKLYNQWKKNCEPEHKVTCGSRIHPDLNPYEPEDKVVDPKPNYKCIQNFGRYNHNDYCNWYYQCHDRLPSVRECRRGWRYDRNRRKCFHKHEVTCDGKPDKEDITTDEVTTSIFTETPEPITTPTTELQTTTTTPEPPISSTIPTTSTEATTIPTTVPTTTTEEPTTIPTTVPTTTTVEPTTTPTPTEPTTTTEEPTTTSTTTVPTTIPTTEPTTTTEKPTTTSTVPSTTTAEPTTIKPKVTAPDTDCDEDDVDCIIEDLGETPDWFVCPDFLGSYPHPSSKKLFIFCLNWKPSVKKCGQDLIFSEDLMTCTHP